jgi:hypothetical protein
VGVKSFAADHHRLRSVAQTIIVFLALVGCERVYYETYTYTWELSNANGMDVAVVATGTSQIDSTGAPTERIGSPYRIGVYIYQAPRGYVPLGLSTITFVGEQSEAVIKATPLPLQGLGDGSPTRVAVAPAVALPFEDYQVHLLVAVKGPSGDTTVRVSGKLRKRLIRRGAFRALEELQA